MLVLTRKLDEAIVIGKDIKITVVQIKGDQVRLGFEAPRDIEIMRSELIDVELSEAPKVDEDTSKFTKALVQAG